MFFIWMAFVCAAAQILPVVKGSKPMGSFIQSVHVNPVLLYECYRNGTSFDTKKSDNVSALFDGTQSGPNDVELTLYFATNGTTGKVHRKRLDLTYDSKTDTTTNPARGKDTVITLLEVYKYNVQYTSERDEGKYARKIYDIDMRCPTAQELYKELCKNGCDLVPSREF